MNRPRQKSSDPSFEIVRTDDGSRTLISIEDNETFHSESGALAEARCVFLQNSGIEQFLMELSPTRVLEIGYGTGLNFLLTAELATSVGRDLRYDAIDNTLLNGPVLRELNYVNHLSNAYLFQNWLDWHCGLQMQQGSSATFDAVEHVTLNLFIDDALNCLDGQGWVDTLDSQTQNYEVIYFDAFSPATSPLLWSEQVFGCLHQMLVPGGKLVTYCVKSTVQQALGSAGFQISKLPGPPGGKREVLVARA